MPATTRAGITNSLIFGFFHCVIGVGLSMVVGFAPEVIAESFVHNSRIEPFGPGFAFTGLMFGFFLSRRLQNGQGASLAWIYGMLWLAAGFFEAAKGWDSTWHPQTTWWDYAIANLFSTSACDECPLQMIFTMPFTASVTYSIGAFTRKFSKLAAKS